MPTILFKLLSDTLIQQVVLLGLEQLAKRSDNTIDDQVVSIVRQGLANRVNPVQRVGGKQ
jgi:hypothetical protein